jgi:hypothetical protein
MKKELRSSFPLNSLCSCPVKVIIIQMDPSWFPEVKGFNPEKDIFLDC